MKNKLLVLYLKLSISFSFLIMALDSAMKYIVELYTEVVV